jgi:hypothetical protein
MNSIICEYLDHLVDKNVVKVRFLVCSHWRTLVCCRSTERCVRVYRATSFENKTIAGYNHHDKKFTKKLQNVWVIT